jgi:hypothetical protein
MTYPLCFFKVPFFLGVLHALTNSTLWAHPCLSTGLSVAFFLGGRQPAKPGVIVAQQWEVIVIVNPIGIVIPIVIVNIVIL